MEEEEENVYGVPRERPQSIRKPQTEKKKK